MIDDRPVTSRRPHRLVLASASPRRRQLLEQLGVALVVRPGDIDESELPGEQPLRYVERLAEEKALAVEAAADEVIIAADTTVDVDGSIFAKPEDAEDARRMLRILSGRTHLVHTGVAIRHGSRLLVGSSTSEVTFVELSGGMISWYVALGEPFGKAGAYALQGAGGMFVERVVGSVSGIIGLPMAVLLDLATRLGVDLLGSDSAVERVPTADQAAPGPGSAVRPSSTAEQAAGGRAPSPTSCSARPDQVSSIRSPSAAGDDRG